MNTQTPSQESIQSPNQEESKLLAGIDKVKVVVGKTDDLQSSNNGKPANQPFTGDEHSEMLALLQRIRQVFPKARLFPCHPETKAATSWQTKFRKEFNQYNFPPGWKPGIVPGDVGRIIADIDAKEEETKAGNLTDPNAYKIEHFEIKAFSKKTKQLEPFPRTRLFYTPEYCQLIRQQGINIVQECWGESEFDVESGNPKSHGLHKWYLANQQLTQLGQTPKKNRPEGVKLQHKWQVGETRFSIGYVAIHSIQALRKIVEHLESKEPKNQNTKPVTYQALQKLADDYPHIDLAKLSKKQTKQTKINQAIKQAEQTANKQAPDSPKQAPSANSKPTCLPNQLIKTRFNAILQELAHADNTQENFPNYTKAFLYGIPLHGAKETTRLIQESIQLSDHFANYGQEEINREIQNSLQHTQSPNFQPIQSLEEEIWKHIGIKIYRCGAKFYSVIETPTGPEVQTTTRPDVNDAIGTFITNNCAFRLDRDQKADTKETARNKIIQEHSYPETTHRLFAPLIIQQGNLELLNLGTCQPTNTSKAQKNHPNQLTWIPNNLQSLDYKIEDHLTPLFNDFLFQYQAALFNGWSPEQITLDKILHATESTLLHAVITTYARLYNSALCGNLAKNQLRAIVLYGATRIGKGWIPKWINRQVLGLQSEYYLNQQLTFGGRFNAANAQTPFWFYQDPGKQEKFTVNAMDLIKQWITESTVTHEKKGIDAIQIPICPLIIASTNIDESSKIQLKFEESFLSKINAGKVFNPIEINPKFKLSTDHPENHFKQNAGVWQRGLAQLYFAQQQSSQPTTKDDISYGIHQFIDSDFIEILQEQAGAKRAEQFANCLISEAKENSFPIITIKEILTPTSTQIISEPARLPNGKEGIRIPTQRIANHLNRKITTKDGVSDATPLQLAYSGWKENGKITVRAINDFIKHEKQLIADRKYPQNNRQRKAAWIYFETPCNPF